MNKITVGFSRSSSKLPIFSWLIMLTQRTNYSHVYIRFHMDDVNRDVVFQASGLQVNIVSLDFFKTKETIVKEFDIPVSDPAIIKIFQRAIDMAGQPYSLLQIINSFIYIICKKAPFDAEIIGWDCSKLVTEVLQKELNIPISEDVDVITPKDLNVFLTNYFNK